MRSHLDKDIQRRNVSCVSTTDVFGDGGMSCIATTDMGLCSQSAVTETSEYHSTVGSGDNDCDNLSGHDSGHTDTQTIPTSGNIPHTLPD